MTEISNLPSLGLVKLVGKLDNTTVTPTVVISPASVISTQVDGTPGNDVLLTEIPLTISADVVDGNGVIQAERFYLVSGTINADGNAEYTTSIRGLLNSNIVNPPTASDGDVRNFKSHKNGATCTIDETWLTRNLQTLFAETSTKNSKVAGENISDNDTVSIHSKNVTTTVDHSGTVAGTVKMTTATAHSLTTGESVQVTGTTDYNGTHTITVVDADEFYFTATFTSDQTGEVTNNKVYKYNSILFPVLAGIANETDTTGNALEYINLRGTKTTPSTNLATGDVFAEDTGTIVDTATSTTTALGQHIGGGVINLAQVAPSSLPELTKVQVEDSAGTTFGSVSGQRLSQAVAANSAKNISMYPKAAGEATSTQETGAAITSNTEAQWMMYDFPASIDLNDFAIRIAVFTTASTFDIAFYSEDGQTKHFEHTTANFTSGSTKRETLASQVTIPQGNILVGFIANSASVNMQFLVWGSDPSFPIVPAAGEPKYSGTTTETAGTLPATIDPTSITNSVNRTLFIRLDN